MDGWTLKPIFCEGRLQLSFKVLAIPKHFSVMFFWDVMLSCCQSL